MNEFKRMRRERIKLPALDPSNRIAYFHELLTRVIYITGDAPLSRGRLRPNRKLTISQWKTAAGMNYVPVFTSLGRLQRAIQLPCAALSVQARDLFQMLRHAQIIVNPGSPDSVAFTPQERWKIAPQGFWTSGNKPNLESLPIKRFMLMPLALQEDLRRYLRGVRTVKNAYIQNVVPAQDEWPMQLMLAVDYRGDPERLQKGLSDVLARSIGSADALALTVTAGDFGMISEEIVQLFYRRKAGWDYL